MRLVLSVLALGLLGCTGTKDSVETRPGAITNTEPAPSCADRVASLDTWLKALAADGPWVGTNGVSLVKLDAEVAKLPTVPVVALRAEETLIEGLLVGSNGTPPAVVATSVTQVLASTKATKVLLLVDKTVPWSRITGVVGGAAAAGVSQVTFVFHATAPSKVSPPPPSSIDADLAAPASGAEPLHEGASGKGIPSKVFANCARVLEDLFPKIAAADAATRTRVTFDGFVKEIAACDCKVEIPAVQRLVWSWWSRDTGTPMAGVTVDITTAKTGVPVTAAPATPWSGAHATVLTVAKQGKPIMFQ